MYQSCVLICGGATWHQVGSNLVISGQLQLLYSPWLPSNLHVVCTLHVLPGTLHVACFVAMHVFCHLVRHATLVTWCIEV